MSEKSERRELRPTTLVRSWILDFLLRRSWPAALVAGWSLVALFRPTLAAAQTMPGSIEIGWEAGRYQGGTLARGSTRFFTGKAEVDENSLAGFWLAAHVTPKWAVEVTYRRSATQVIGYSGGLFPQQPTLAGLDVTMLEAIAQRCYRVGRFAPYFGGGAGFTNLDIDLSDKSRRNPSRGSLAAGGGARFYLTPWLGLRIDMRVRAAYLGRRDDPYDHGWGDTGRWYKSLEGMGGLFIALGRW